MASSQEKPTIKFTSRKKKKEVTKEKFPKKGGEIVEGIL